MRLASTFGSRTPISQLRGSATDPLTEDKLRAYVPSIFADGAHESRSARYGYIPTIEMVRGLNGEGFVPTFAVEAKARDHSKDGFTKHLVRFQRQDMAVAHGRLGGVPELILLNSHDGSSSYQLLAGFLRFVCLNGMVVGDCFEEVRVQHRTKRNLVQDVIEGAFTVANTFKDVIEQGENMKARMLTGPQKEAFGEAALAAKYYDPETDKVEAPITPRQVIAPRRHEDTAGDLWTVFNRTQENMIRGGLYGTTTGADGRRRNTTTRAVNGIDGNVKLNRALWTLASKMAELTA
jgi:hypothetical protein